MVVQRQHEPNLELRRLKDERRKTARLRGELMILSLFLMVGGLVYLSYKTVTENLLDEQENAELAQPMHQQNEPELAAPLLPQSVQSKVISCSELNCNKCAFRTYPPNRLYGLSSTSQPNFLSDVPYIRGQWPIIINPIEHDNLASIDGKYNQQTNPVKVCIDTSSWEDLKDKDGRERLPFTDGHNPCVMSMASNPYNTNKQHVRLDPTHLKPIASAFPSISLDSLFMGVTIFGGGQCKFGFTPQEVDKYRFSVQDEPQGGKRAVIAILAPPNNGDQSSFQTLTQTTLLLERDTKYGTHRRNALQPEKTPSGEFARMHQEFDDPRLFFHLGRVWVLYRNGPLFGYEDQIHNPIHFEEVTSTDDSSNVKFVAYVKASETVRVCCGRNIALISEEPVKNDSGEIQWVQNPTLKALTWVDPVTVRDDVKMNGVEEKLARRRLQEGNDNTLDLHHRRLGGKTPLKSNIHGTNGYMVPLPSTGELLGMAHFHRPENRRKSDFALHGHHYTHALFTIARAPANDATQDYNSRPFKLSRLSNEFVFRANSIPAGEKEPPVDGDVIQFASGLDVVGSDTDGQLVVSYGINDCEGGVFTLAMQKVQEMLMDVDPEQEAVDLMFQISLNE